MELFGLKNFLPLKVRSLSLSLAHWCPNEDVEKDYRVETPRINE